MSLIDGTHDRVWRAPWAGVATLSLLIAALVTPGSATAMELAVTVDDLPTHGLLPRGVSRLAVATQMIDVLRRHATPGAHGFTNGGQLQDDPGLEAILRAWREAGFPLGNHTFSHLDLTRVSAEEFIADIERNEGLLARLSPPGARKYFRYPYLHEGNTPGKRNTVRRWLAARGYTIAQATVYFEDWAWNETYARCVAVGDQTAIARLKDLFIEAAMAHRAWSEAMSARLFTRPIKHILLLHIGPFDALMLDELLRAYRAAGTILISLDAALEDPVYQFNPDLAWDGERTFLQQVAQAKRIETPPRPPGAPRELSHLCR